MARIRSIHPSLFSDENYMAMSVWAKAAWPALWTECDDHGAFEWKPLVLKARIFPADHINFEQLLEEYERCGNVRKFSTGGKTYGLVRNFCRFQRPKKPKYRVVIPDEFRTFVALDEAGGEPVPHQYGTGGEKSPQIEGGRREEKKERKEDTADAVSTTNEKSSSEDRYFFEKGVVRLKKKDFDQWKQAFSHLDLAAELIALAPWAEQQSKWFHAVAGALAKRNRELGLRLEQGKNGPTFKTMSGMEGII